MSYNITHTDGTPLVTIADGTSDSSTSLRLVGKNYAGYGLLLNENFVKLLENFSNTTSPTNPLKGQVWWDNLNNILKVYDSVNWKNVSGSITSAIAPANSVTGDTWWDTTNGQLNVWSGLAWVVIGPAFTSMTGQTEAIADTVIDTDGPTSHIILKFYVQNQLVSILSKDALFHVNTLPGFIAISPGFNLSSSFVGIEYNGTATNADNLGGVLAASYLRNDISGTVSGNLTVTADSGLYVGSTSVLNINSSGSAVNLNSTTNSKNLNLSVKVGGVQTTLLTLGTNGNITVPTASPNDNSTRIASTAYVDNGVLGAASLALDGSIQITGNITPATNNLYNFGNASTHLNTVYATSFSGTANNATYLGGVISSNYADKTANPVFSSNVSVTASTVSTSSSTGALVITGGVGIGGNLNVSGTATAPTPTNGDNSTKIATTAFVQSASTSTVPVGTIIDFASNVAPTNYVICPLSQAAANVLIATYPSLSAVVGTHWGPSVGGGFTMPWFPADYAAVQANSNVGVTTVGAVIAHTHPDFGVRSNGSGGGVDPTQVLMNNTQNVSSGSTGGAANLAAGMRVTKCVKYQ